MAHSPPRVLVVDDNQDSPSTLVDLLARDCQDDLYECTGAALPERRGAYNACFKRIAT